MRTPENFPISNRGSKTQRSFFTPRTHDRTRNHHVVMVDLPDNKGNIHAIVGRIIADSPLAAKQAETAKDEMNQQYTDKGSEPVFYAGEVETGAQYWRIATKQELLEGKSLNANNLPIVKDVHGFGGDNLPHLKSMKGGKSSKDPVDPIIKAIKDFNKPFRRPNKPNLRIVRPGEK